MRAIFIIDAQGHRPPPPRLAHRRPLPVGRRHRTGASPASLDAERRPRQFAVGEGHAVRGEAAGEGAPIVLCHGLTATRRSVVHGSRAWSGPGTASSPTTPAATASPIPPRRRGGYGYPELVEDLEPVVAATGGRGALPARRPLDGRPHRDRLRASPSRACSRPGRDRPDPSRHPCSLGGLYDPKGSEHGVAGLLGRVGGGAGEGGVDGFVAYIGRAQEIDRSVARLGPALHPGADGTASPARRDGRGAARGAALAVRSARSRSSRRSMRRPWWWPVATRPIPAIPTRPPPPTPSALPQARLVSEAEGQSPLAWQGGRLSREIAAFCA